MKPFQLLWWPNGIDRESEVIAECDRLSECIAMWEEKVAGTDFLVDVYSVLNPIRERIVWSASDAALP